MLSSDTLVDTSTEIASDSLVRSPGKNKALPAGANLVIFHIGEYSGSGVTHKSITRRLSLPVDVLVRSAAFEIDGYPNAKTTLVTPTGEEYNVVETFDVVTSLIATRGKDSTLVLAPIPSLMDAGIPMLQDNDSEESFPVDLSRGFTNAGCGSAKVWDTSGEEHWVQYGRDWNTDSQYPLDKLISSGKIQSGITPES